MNILLFDSHELGDGGRLVIADERARHIVEVQGTQVGHCLTVGQLGGGIGVGKVLSIDGQRVEIEVGPLSEPADEPQIDLVVALPRPQILKKVLQTAATMGVRRLMLIRSARVIKSYFATPLLAPEKIRQQLLLGLEQGVATRLPEVTIHSRFRPFVEEELSVERRQQELRLLMHPRGQHQPEELLRAEPGLFTPPVCLAIGPEGGWDSFEVEAFERAGFIGMRSGQRIMRVDTAVAVLLGQVQLILRYAALGESAETGKSKAA